MTTTMTTTTIAATTTSATTTDITVVGVDVNVGFDLFGAISPTDIIHAIIIHGLRLISEC